MRHDMTRIDSPAIVRPHPDPAGGPDWLTFDLLGPIRAWSGGEEIDLGSPQQRATLAVLLLHEGTVVTVDELVRAVWGDEPPRAAVTTVRTYVSRLRRVQAPRPDGSTGLRIRSIGRGYSLDVPSDSVDVVRFRRHTTLAAAATRRGDFAVSAMHLRSALALRHGSPLAGAPGPYAHSQRTRLQQLITTAELDLISAEINVGRHHEVLPELSVFVAENPLWERVHELYMTALYRCGRQADALAHYQATRQELVDNLGIEPGVVLRELHRRILAGEVGMLPDRSDDVCPALHLRVNRPRPVRHRADANRIARFVRR
ncbi:AfsR/SARP family transcriptional regulator [Micromonospora radicis]|uniref:OmpR/PhoB-type domain-containing protein n=1 Tax=Micromonospora radicis TaxID=1894971 RepID=A0A418MN79_9ACTN|nr:AfsR/SARP family transcriptional regulator [Micromonospora radicis]RIV31604.1 hypothetical protein D2L64_25610 [Micromonospora radicis]